MERNLKRRNDKIADLEDAKESVDRQKAAKE